MTEDSNPSLRIGPGDYIYLANCIPIRFDIIILKKINMVNALFLHVHCADTILFSSRLKCQLKVKIAKKFV